MAWQWYWDYTYHCWSCYYDDSGDTCNLQSQSGGGSEGGDGTSSGSQPPSQSSAHARDPGDADTFKWTTSYEKNEAELHYRLRTLKATPIEHDKLTAAVEGNDGRLIQF